MPRPKDYDEKSYEELSVNSEQIPIKPDDPDRYPGKAEQAERTTPPGKPKTAPADAAVHDPDADETLRQLDAQRDEFIVLPDDSGAGQ